MTPRWLSWFVLAFVLTGCAQTVVLYRNPVTKKYDGCEQPPWGSHEDLVQCMQRMEATGWVKTTPEEVRADYEEYRRQAEGGRR